MDPLMIAGFACIALGLVIAYVTSLRERSLQKLPCMFCGRLLTPPLYLCKHHIGDGREFKGPRVTVGATRAKDN
ncbi:MAG: hypothetical protein ABSB70_05825 [Candidatus Velthaea sp.]|jgi:hypothetical protein